MALFHAASVAVLVSPSTNFGAPLALVTGTVVQSIHQYWNSGTLEICPDVDARWVRHVNNLTNLLLNTAAALEVVSIFVITITSTMLNS